MGLQRRKFLAAAARLAAAGFFIPQHLVRAVEKGKEFNNSDELFDAYTSGRSKGLTVGHNVIAGDYDSSEALYKAYADGAEGSVFEPGRLDKVLSTLRHGRFCEAAPGLVGSGKGKVSLPFRNVLYFDPLYYHLAQTTLDCTSFGSCGAADGSRATQITDKKTAEQWVTRGATEAIYGARNSPRGGMDPARAAQWLHDEGGVLLRKKYGNIDLTTYDGSVGARWGGSGIPREILVAAAEHRVGEIALITSVAEARDALANGYFLSCGSGYGFTRTRDKKGFCRRSKGWNHCMHWTACDDYSFGECAFLVQNSWGDYVDGGDPEWGELPCSSFLVHEEDAAGMIAQRGMWAFSMVNGWPARELKKFGTSDYAWRAVRMLFNAIS